MIFENDENFEGEERGDRRQETEDKRQETEARRQKTPLKTSHKIPRKAFTQDVHARRPRKTPRKTPRKQPTQDVMFLTVSIKYSTII